MSGRALPLAVLTALVLLAAAPARAAGPPSAETPRGAVQAFLDAAATRDWDRAADFLDLSRVQRAARAAQGRERARELATVLDQTLIVDPDALSDEPGGRRDDGLAAAVERLGTVPTRRGPVDLTLHRTRADDGRDVWQLSAATVARVPALYRELGGGPLAALLPAPLVEVRLLEVALWQWIGLMLLVVAAYGLAWAATLVLVRVLRPVVRRSRTALDDMLLATLVGPAQLGLGLVVFSLGVLALALALPVRRFFLELEKAAAILVVAWALLRLVDVLAGVVAGRLAARGRAGAVAMVPMAGRTLKVTVLGFALIAVLQNVGLNVTGILAGLGIGGLAVALAAQKTVENLFGGISLILDQPVRVGDFCRFGDHIGTVEEIGLRSTRVRTLDRTVVAVPNAQFSTLPLENFSRRDRVWLHATLGLRYETTPDQLRYVLIEVRRMLYAHPRVHPDPARIRFVGFGAYSLDCEIFAYVLTPDYGEYLAIQEDIFLRIMDIVAAGGTGFAFPSQTLYLGRDGGLDRGRTKAAEARVRAWRDEHGLFLPEFPAEQIAGLRGTLRYPPDGAPAPPPA